MTVGTTRFERERRHPGRTVVSASSRSTGILTLLLYSFSSFALQIRLGPEVFLFPRAQARAGAMTIGCPDASCCTSRCYLDERGMHHCVSAGEKSCDCGLSSGKTTAGTILTENEAIIPVPELLVSDVPYSLLAREASAARHPADVPPLTPPPRPQFSPLT